MHSPTPTRNADPARRDRAVLGHPCCGLQDHEGRRYLAAISHRRVDLFGHCHPAHTAAAPPSMIETGGLDVRVGVMGERLDVACA